MLSGGGVAGSREAGGVRGDGGKTGGGGARERGRGSGGRAGGGGGWRGMNLLLSREMLNVHMLGIKAVLQW